MRRMNAFDWVAFILLVVGGINWGLIGLFGLNVVEVIFGSGTPITNFIYVLVGLSALYMVFDVARSYQRK